MAALRWFIVLPAILVSLLIRQPAGAESPTGAETANLSPLSTRLAEILARLERPEPGHSWLAQHMAGMNVSGKYGLTYTRHFEAGAKGMRFRIGGPALRGIKRVGLALEVRF